MGEEEVLAGGIANQGLVVRIGDTVRRPVRASSRFVQTLLGALEAVGFEEAPRYLGSDEDGREVFSYIPGEVGVPPFSGFFASDAALCQAAGLLSRYHQAVASLDPAGFEGFCDELADPEGGGLVCHNDLCVENVVFRDGRAAGLIDFDFAAPGRALWDAAMAARMWAPLAHPDCRTAWPDGLDASGRLGVFARAYGVIPDEAEAFVEAVFLTHRVGRDFVRRHVAAGEPAFVEMWNNFAGSQRDALDEPWLEANRTYLIPAVASS